MKSMLFNECSPHTEHSKWRSVVSPVLESGQRTDAKVAVVRGIHRLAMACTVVARQSSSIGSFELQFERVAVAMAMYGDSGGTRGEHG